MMIFKFEIKIVITELAIIEISVFPIKFPRTLQLNPEMYIKMIFKS